MRLPSQNRWVGGLQSFHLRWIGAPLLIASAFSGCLRTTPFDANPERRDLNAHNLERLRDLPAPQGPLRFVAIGDTHDEYDDLVTTAKIINRRADLSFVVHTGDISDRGLLDEFEWAQDALDTFDIPVFMSIGNHDAISSGKKIYRKMYGPFDYSFVYGNVKFVFFNSNTLEFPGVAPDRSWLLDQVSQREGAEGLVLVTHHGPHNADDIDGGDHREFYRDLLRNYDVTLFIHGHLADWQLSVYEGVPVLQTGTFQDVRTHTLVTIDGATVLGYERCRFDDCRAAEPVGDPSSAGADP